MHCALKNTTWWSMAVTGKNNAAAVRGHIGADREARPYPPVSPYPMSALIPLSGAAKVKADVCAVGTAALAYYFKEVPWTELAACAAFIYTSLRILEWAVSMIIRLIKRTTP